MADDVLERLIQESPIGNGLDGFRTSFLSICEGNSLPCTLDAVNHLTQEGKDVNSIVAIIHLTVIQIFRMSHLTYYLLCGIFLQLEPYHRKQVLELFRTTSGD